MAAIKNLILPLKPSACRPSWRLLYLNIKEYGLKTLPRVSYQDFLHWSQNIAPYTSHLESKKILAYSKTDVFALLSISAGVTLTRYEKNLEFPESQKRSCLV